MYCKNQIVDVHHCELASTHFSKLILRQFLAAKIDLFDTNKNKTSRSVNESCSCFLQ